jgi:hypothetical protein
MNRPSDPDSFVVAFHTSLTINVSNRQDDARRMAAEHWCYHNTEHPWCRRVLTRLGIVRFEFANLNEGMMFRLTH